MIITIKTLGQAEVYENLKAYTDNFQTNAYAVTKHYGALLMARIRANARSKFEVTDYTTQLRMRMGAGGISYPLVEVGTDEEQGFRLERGFVGIDSAGREVFQEPRPHFGPALDVIGPQYERAIAGLLKP